MAKIGSPLRNFVHDKKGKLIAGLRLDTGTKTYYTPIKDEQGKNKKKTFGRDLEKAIQKFEHWQNQDNELELMNRITYMEMDRHWDYFKDKLLNDGAYAAKKLDMPCFADPDFLKDYRPKKSYTIAEIWDNYLKRVQSITPKELADTKASWIKFANIVDVKTVSGLTKEAIRKYYDALYGEFKKDKSTSWLKNHFERVKRVFNYALDSFDDISQLIEVKQRLASVLKSERASILCPAKKIPKELFWQIMDASTVEEKAMWLLSINMGYYSIDIVTLPLNAINFKNKTIIFRRGKTGVHRAGILWNETIKAIKDYQKEKPHNSELLFYNLQNKQPYEPNRIRKKFNEVLENLGIRTKSKDKKVSPSNYKHSHFRDSFESVCAAKNITQQSIDAVMGHTGISTKYTDVESTPEITAPACQAVREFYFGNKAAS